MRKLEFTLNIPKEMTLINLCTGFIHHASEFVSDITIQVNDSAKIDLKSILGTTSLVYANGKTVTIEINGKDEDLAYMSLERYAERIRLEQ